MYSLPDVLCSVVLLFYAVMWGILFSGLYLAKTRYSKQATPITAPTEGVSILRPLRGLDNNLYSNLEASFRQDYPKFEIIFSVASNDDQAIPIVKDLMQRYPHVDASIIIGEQIVGVNPKINNLIRSYASAKYDILWIIDSNVLVSTSTLSHSVSALQGTDASGRPIGLVHHVPYAVYPDLLLGSRVEHAFLCTNHARMYLALNASQLDSCVTGKSNLFRRSVLEKAVSSTSLPQTSFEIQAGSDLQGLARFGEYLGEDNMIGRAIWHELGMRHALVPGCLAANAVGSMTITDYFWRRVRWIRVRKYMVVSSTLLEPLTESFLLGFLTALSLHHFSLLSAWIFLPLHFALWLLLDIQVFKYLSLSTPVPNAVTPDHEQPTSLAFLKAWLVREASAFPIWCFAMCGNSVGWRDDRVYKVRMDGKVVLAASRSRDYTQLKSNA